MFIAEALLAAMIGHIDSCVGTRLRHASRQSVCHQTVGPDERG
jgi:hypothetical protein